ncbi:MAG: redoxin domain-containing protein, partial [Bacteroidales bacterium]|nr:redoxin domain-containing protein [Bacteroidales bacterium]
LKAYINNIPANEIFLVNFYGDKSTVIDSVKVDSTGFFKFIMNDNYPVGLYRIILGNHKFVDIIFNKENIEFKTVYENPTDSIKIISSVENKIYYDFMFDEYKNQLKLDLLMPLIDYFPKNDTFYNNITVQFINIQKHREKLINDIIKDYPAAYATRLIKMLNIPFIEPDMPESERIEYLKTHFFDDIDFTDISLLRSNAYTNKIITYLSLYSNRDLTQEMLEESFIKAVDVVMYKTLDNNIIYDFTVDYLASGFEKYHFEKVLEYIAENYTPDIFCENKERKSDLKTRLEKFQELSIGKKAPDIEITDINGEKIKLSEIKSKYTLVIFWASWCPHCTEILREIKKIYEEQNKKEIEILAISLDTKKGDWEDVISQENYSWINCSDLKSWDSKAALDYNIYATPTMFLLDKNKNILAKPITIQELIKELEKLN